MIYIDIECFKGILELSLVISTLTCSLVQKTKKFLPSKKLIIIYNLMINLLTSYLFCLTFTKYRITESIWAGFISFLGSDTIYKLLDKKLLSYSQLKQNIK